MSRIDIAATMDAIKTTLVNGGRTESIFPWPVEDCTPPCWVVGYPKSLDFDMTFRNGADKAVFPVHYLVSRNDPKTARDQLSAIIEDADGVKALLDGNLGGVIQSARVTDCQITFVEIAAVPYAAAEFSLEVIS